MKYKFFSTLVVFFIALNLKNVIMAESVYYSGNCGENVTWTLEDGVLDIRGSGDMTDYKKFDQVPWYNMRTTITDISIEPGITSIGEGAFHCTSIHSIEIPDTVERIGASAFDTCTQLETIKIPERVKELNDLTFNYCTSLTSFEMPNSILSIGTACFSDCRALSSVIFSNRLTTIGLNSFS